MFFADYTTPYEQRTGFVAREALLNRLIAAKAEFLDGDGAGYMASEVSIQVGDKAYELLFALCETPIETCPDDVSWCEWTMVDRRFTDGNGGPTDFSNVPLTLAGAVEALSALYGLDPKLVWDTGIDLKAYWASNPPGNEDAPLPEDAEKFSLRALHGVEYPYSAESPA
jgi:hypothetical protein